MPRSVDPQTFKLLMGALPTGVTVVTTVDRRGRIAGMTASALASASLDPPLLLVCVTRETDFHAAIVDARRFAVNVLAHDQEHLSHRFATELDDRFAGVAWRRETDGLPLLEGTVAGILCERWETCEAGDHTIVLGRVTGGEVADRRPLVHLRGRYYAGP